MSAEYAAELAYITSVLSQPIKVEQQKAAEATTEEQHHEAIREALN